MRSQTCIVLMLSSLIFVLSCVAGGDSTAVEESNRFDYSTRSAAQRQFFQFLFVDDYESAESLLKELLLSLPNDPSILDWLGNLRFMAGDTDEALTYYERAISAEPTYAHTYFDRGSVYLELEKYDLALVDLQKAVDIDPEYHDFQLALGCAYFTIGDSEASLAHLRRAVAIDGDSSAARFYLGLAYAALGDQERAEKEFAWILATDPDSYEAQVLRENMGY